MFKVADALCHLLFLVVHAGYASPHLYLPWKGSGVAIFRFYLFNFLLWLPVFYVTFVQLLKY